MRHCMTGKIDFGSKSQKALKQVRQVIRNHKLAASLLGGASAASIFARKPLTTAYNLTQHDWDLFIEAMGAIGKITRHSIQIQAGVMAQDHSLPSRERKFWTCVLTNSGQ